MDRGYVKMSIDRMKYMIIPILVISAMFTDSGCNKKETAVNNVKSINVATKQAETKSLRPFIEAVGTLNPYDEVTISTEVDGVIESVRMDEGTIITKGMLIATIKDTDYLLEVTRAKAAMKQAEANLANTGLEYQRKKSLYDDGLLSQNDFDSVSTRRSLAESDAENAGAALSIAEHRLTKTKIYSPIAGVVKVNNVSGGNFIRTGTAICTIVQVDPLKLNFTVSEKDAGILKKGQDLQLKVETFPDREFNGKLSIIYPGLDEKTRTLMAEAVIPNPGGILRPGFFTTVKLYTGGAKGTVLVPATALLYEGETIKVFTVENETAKERKVKIGNRYGEMMEITEGLKSGDIVVIAGQQSLSEGIRVHVAR